MLKLKRFRPEFDLLEGRDCPSNMGTLHLTDSTVTVVEETQYASKHDVYAYGNFLVDGYYDVEVVAPGGKSNGSDAILGLSDPNSPIQVLNGHVVLGSPSGPVTPGTAAGPRGYAFNVWDEVYKVSNNTQGFDNTGNSGGVYQVVVAQHILGETQDNFSQFTGNNAVTKSKNFKAPDDGLTLPPPTGPESTSIVTNFILTRPDGTIIGGPNVGGTFVVAGSTAQDFASVFVTDGSGNIVTEGFVDFQLFGPNGLIDDTTVPVINGVATDPFVSLPLDVGEYHFVAGYSDAGNTDVDAPAIAWFASSQSESEPFTIIKATPSLTTTASEVGNVVGSARLSDSATIVGYKLNGTLDFTLTKPDGTVVDVGTVAVTGSGTYSAPTDVFADEVGVYVWHATYSGDFNNNVAGDDGTNESLEVIKASPTLVTTASPTGVIYVGVSAPILSDSGVLAGGYNETGTLTFVLTGPHGYSFTKTIAVNGNGTYSVSTNTETELGLYTWVVTYNGDVNNNTAVDQGGEAEQVTIRDQVTQGESATLGFWSNKNGQALLKTYGAELGNWLGITYGNLFGNLSGATGKDVASYFLKVKAAASGSVYNTYAQVLTTALDVWVTGLGWNLSSMGPTHYGFHQGFGGTGLGDVYYNVGTNGSSFGVANNTYVKVSDLLAYLNARCVRVGGSYANLPTFTFYGNNNTVLLGGANNVFNGINNTGDII